MSDRDVLLGCPLPSLVRAPDVNITRDAQSPGKNRAAAVEASRQNAATGKNSSDSDGHILKEICAGSASLAFGHGIRQPCGRETV
jgi:hypothetical protein